MKSDFGDILKQFEGSQKSNKKFIHNAMLDHMDKYGVKDKDVLDFQKNKCVNHKKLTSDDTIDLHGLTSKEALEKLKLFFDNAVKNRYKKVSIIHGKGKHSKVSAVLYEVVRKFLEENKHAGKSGFEKNDKGGSGTTWVMLKYEV
ncbi:MAG: Smr/MutS family protein [Treponema sp.]